MATWIVHLRIADEFFKRNLIPHKREFVLGSVAPDCGYGEKDSFGDFSPPPEITHWAPGGIKVYCEYWKFYNEYLKNKLHDKDYYFYLGYYVHLITDILWSTMMYLPTKIKYAKQYKENPEFLRIIKKDWYDLDFKFLRDNDDFVPYRLLCQSNTVKDYLPYYEKNQLSVQTKFISDYYKNSTDRVLDREYKYLDEETMNLFIKQATEIIEFDLTQKQLVKF